MTRAFGATGGGGGGLGGCFNGHFFGSFFLETLVLGAPGGGGGGGGGRRGGGGGRRIFFEGRCCLDFERCCATTVAFSFGVGSGGGGGGGLCTFLGLCCDWPFELFRGGGGGGRCFFVTDFETLDDFEPPFLRDEWHAPAGGGGGGRGRFLDFKAAAGGGGGGRLCRCLGPEPLVDTPFTGTFVSSIIKLQLYRSIKA